MTYGLEKHAGRGSRSRRVAPRRARHKTSEPAVETPSVVYFDPADRGRSRGTHGPPGRTTGSAKRPNARMTEPDPETIERARGGDVQAYGEIVRYYQAPVLSTIHRLIGGQYANEVEDLGQDLFFKIYRALHRFDPDRGVKFSTWLFTSVKNLCYDHLRKRRLPTESLDRAAGDDEDRAPLQVASPGRTPHETTETGELGQRIAKAVQRLPMDQRVVFVLREYERFSYEEIAQMTETSIGTVKSRLFRAKENLRFMLSDYVRTT